jgi:hypothetical protein
VAECAFEDDVARLAESPHLGAAPDDVIGAGERRLDAVLAHGALSRREDRR